MKEGLRIVAICIGAGAICQILYEMFGTLFGKDPEHSALLGMVVTQIWLARFLVR